MTGCTLGQGGIANSLPARFAASLLGRGRTPLGRLPQQYHAPGVGLAKLFAAIARVRWMRSRLRRLFPGSRVR